MQTRLCGLIILGIIIFCSGGCNKNSNPAIVNPPPATSPPAAYIRNTIQYKSIANTPANLLSLDVYSYGQNNNPKPVVIYVHGGGWRIGDKLNSLDNKLSLFNSLNYIFISINYRLSPNPSSTDPNRIKYPDHNKDVADAVKWVFNNISAYGGDPVKVALMGHSAGAHLVSLTGTSQQFMPGLGFPVNKLKGVASIDTEGYDVPSQNTEDIYINAFGTDQNIQAEASPILNLFSGISYPRFFIAKRGSPQRINFSDLFINKLVTVGVNVSQVTGSRYDHEGINNAIGAPGETAITDPLKVFFQQCLL